MSNAPIAHRGARVLCSASCPVLHIETGIDRINEPQAGWPDIRGLHSLNASRNQWLAGDAIEVSIEAYIRGFPTALQQRIGYQGLLALQPSIWHGPGTPQHNKGRERLAQAIASPARRLVRNLKATEYNIFPICSNGNHWVLVVLHKNQVPSTADPTKREWSRVVQAVVLDPFRSSQRTDFVHETLRRWLTQAGQFTFAPNYVQNVWVPLQHDDSSCGPRAYWHAKQILDRLLALHENGINYNPSLWGDLSGWFNEGFVRDEMIGRCATTAVRLMDYNARVAVEVVNRTKDFNTANANWKVAGTMMKPTDITGDKPESRPSGFQMNPLPGQGLEQLAPPDVTNTPGYTGRMGTGNNNNNNNNNLAPPQETQFIPPPLVPNQHQIAPGVSPSKKQTPGRAAKGDGDADSSSSMSPTYPTVSPPKRLIIPVTPGSEVNTAIDLTSSPQTQPFNLSSIGSPSVPKVPRINPPKPPKTTRKTTPGTGFLATGTKNVLGVGGSTGTVTNPFVITDQGVQQVGTGPNPAVGVLGGFLDPRNTSSKNVTPLKTSPGKRPASGGLIGSAAKKQKPTPKKPKTPKTPKTPRGPPRPLRGGSSRRTK
ncbi:hypothetical protein F4801DRAFT_385710 [Xylaria longipes]|nr:hypothetical protein F4801DRAFT_385710 [Xylaria longipes]